MISSHGLQCLFPCSRGQYSLMLGSPTPGAGGLQGFLVPPFVESLHVVVASQEAVSGLQFTPQQVQEVVGKMAPPMVDLTHDNVSGPLRKNMGNVGKKSHSVMLA